MRKTHFHPHSHPRIPMKTISNAVLITLPGMEDIACQELREQTGIAGKAFPSFVLFSAQKEQLYTLAYTSQSARTLGIVLSLIEHQQEDPEQLIKKINNRNFPCTMPQRRILQRSLFTRYCF